MTTPEGQALHVGALFLLGFLGSGHCVGMCGPLVVALPARVGGVSAHLAYHAGRVATYGLVGASLGALGAGIARLGGQGSLAWTARIQLGTSLVAALLLALFGLARLGLVREPAFLSLANPGRLPGFGRLRRRLGDAARPGAGAGRTSPLGALFGLGLLLGLLPCGLSFAAFARSLATHDPLQGGLLALAFGVGTLPALLGVGLFASRLQQAHRRASDVIAGMLMIGMAAALLADWAYW